MNKWTQAEIDVVTQNMNKLSKQELLNLLPERTWKAIQMRAFYIRVARGHKLRTYSKAPRKTFNESFWSRVDKIQNGCWVWKGCILKDGYGQVGTRKDRGKRAHRVAYEALRGPIPEGLVLDHLCCNTSCVNPDHLEPVTNQENVIRGYLRKYKKSHDGTFQTITSVER